MGSAIERTAEKAFKLPLLELINIQAKAPISINVNPKTLVKAVINIKLTSLHLIINI